ncbi:VOC family protein [Jiangella mangrovi]|uniref:Catechol 2,3-dioxygenase-like lactoylglutathione lyase family enzyme n=1 Tax=Jiangella mangrovi TaxID=1524084 RepID=A0A7W9GNH2_9ACTN|nr:VOC family protein [Jiangella mangrovi]MBB5786939.1 catechol 2,3-dioxygenase-like lactoylglutathione lyase family enzyme [Jiangella mangrovi]
MIPGLDVPTIAGPIKQVALVVRDLDASVRAWTEQLGVGPWTAYELGPGVLKDMTYLGEPAEFSIRHALAWTDTVQFELVQPLSGPSIWADHLAEHGEGLHHLGVYVDDHAAAVERVLAAGYRPLQSARGFGATGDGAFAYFDTDHPLAAVLELIEAPSVRREPAFVYPVKETTS